MIVSIVMNGLNEHLDECFVVVVAGVGAAVGPALTVVIVEALFVAVCECMK